MRIVKRLPDDQAELGMRDDKVAIFGDNAAQRSVYLKAGNEHAPCKLRRRWNIQLCWNLQLVIGRGGHACLSCALYRSTINLHIVHIVSMPKEKRKVTECEHKTARHYAHGLCRNCYLRQHRAGNKIEHVPPDDGKLDLTKREVAQFVAQSVVAKGMDVAGALKAIQPTLTPAEVAGEARRVAESPEVQTLIEEELKHKGLDQASKDGFVEEMWRWLYHGNKDLKIAAARILGRGFIAEKVDSNKPQELIIRNYGEGIQRMFSEDEDALESADRTNELQ